MSARPDVLHWLDGLAEAAGDAPESAGPLDEHVAAVIAELDRKRRRRNALVFAAGVAAAVLFVAWRWVPERLGLEGSIGLSQILGLPGVLVPPSDDGSAQRLGKSIKDLVSQAAGALVEMRAEEGAALEEDLTKNAESLDAVVDKIVKRMPEVVDQHHAMLRKRVEELLGEGAALAPADLSRELAVIADKGDVSEEISRLRSHLTQLESILKKGGAVGRKLDFLVQELVREVNTIGSKCSDATVSHWVDDAKTCIERLREQVQNVE